MFGNLLMVAARVVGDLLKENLDSQAGTPSVQSGGYNFGAHMRGLSQATGIRLSTCFSDSAVFRAMTRDDSRYVMVSRHGDKALLSVFSDRVLPDEFVTTGLRGTLARLNSRAEGFAYGIEVTEAGSSIYVGVEIPLARMTPAVFVAAVLDLMPHMAAVDRAISEQACG